MPAATPKDAFEGAAAYASDALANYGHLESFVRRRQAIEDEYARSLRKLCKSVSLIPHEQDREAAEAARKAQAKAQRRSGVLGWLFRMKKRGDAVQQQDQEAPAEPLPTATRSAVWATFFELVDDTAQLAKAHAALADSLGSQVAEPLAATLKEMRTGRRTSVAEGAALTKELERSSETLARALQAYQAAVAEAGKARVALDDAAARASEARAQLGDAPESAGQRRALDAKESTARDRLRRAEDAAVKSRQDLRMLEETHRAMHGRVYAQDIPRLLGRMSTLERERSRDVLGHMVALVELERRTTSMAELCVQEMAGRVRSVDAGADERAYVSAFLSAPLPPPPTSMLPSQPSSSALFTLRDPQSAAQAARSVAPATSAKARASSAALADADLPRTPSNPPAYASHDESTDALDAPQRSRAPTAPLYAV